MTPQRILAVLGLVALCALNGTLCGLAAHGPLLALAYLWSVVSGAFYGAGVLVPTFTRRYR